jgi:hypothetical protein
VPTSIPGAVTISATLVVRLRSVNKHTGVGVAAGKVKMKVRR